MNIIKPLLISTAILFSASSFADENQYQAGEKLFNTFCTACHGMTGGMDMSKRIAPPIAGVRKHYIDQYPDEASFVKAISAWVEKQDESKSLMRGAIRKFKIMPPIVVPKEDVEKIAAYIYAGNIEKPEGMDKHINEMHGKKNQKGMQKHQMKGNMKNAMRGNGNINKMMQQLNLSPQQKQKMQQLIQQKQATLQPLKTQLQQINQTINQLDTANPDYKKQVFALADKKAKLVYRIAIEKGESRLNIESVLNPEQRAKFKQIRSKRFKGKAQ